MFAALVWWCWMLVAMAQVEVPLEVVVLDDQTGCPEIPETHVPGIVRTSAGLAIHDGAGSYHFACASQFGGAPDGPVAASSDGSLMYFIGDGRVFRSESRGCDAEEVFLQEGYVGVDVLFWRQAFWLLTARLDGGGGLVRLDGAAVLPLATWESFTPDAMLPEGGDHLWVTGAEPEVEVRRLSLAGGLAGDEALIGLPADAADVERIEPVAAQDGEVWLRLERGTVTWAWHGAVLDDESVRFTDVAARGRNFYGPVFADGGWYAVVDQKLLSAPAEVGVLSPTGQDALWTCLHAVGARVFACTVAALLSVEDLGGPDGPVTHEVFALEQVGSPDVACDGSAACLEDWGVWGGAADLVDASEPAVCPDGRRTATGAPGDCGCTSGAPQLPVMLAWLACLAIRRRHEG